MNGPSTLLFVYVGAALGFSFLCSLLEASFLSAPMMGLIERRDSGDRSAALLLHLKQERLDDSLSAILILNTIANTAGATLAGAEAETLFGGRQIVLLGFEIPWVGIFTASLILGILVGSEIIPKTLGAVYASRLVPFTAHAVRILTLAFSWILKLTNVITSLLAKGQQKTPISRRELAAMVATAAREGTLADPDSRLVTNILSYHEIKVEDVMTPRTVMSMMPATASIEELMDDENARVFSRIPLYKEERDNVVGYILQREVLAAAARGRPLTAPLEGFVRKALYIPEGQTVGRALRNMTSRREHLALVTDEYGGLSGLVTLEDLVETTLGVEILDESDRVADLRGEAAKLRDKRLLEFEAWRQSVIAERTEPTEDDNP